jgi:protein tyrosine phosphatase domain-containing protein 1
VNCSSTHINRNNIRGIVNLQQKGEHPYCGDGILSEAKFSYDPEKLINKGIIVRNFPWEDMSIPTVDIVLNAVKFMHKLLSLGSKVLVHCHAGRGRTCLTIGSYLVYAEGKSAEEAVDAMNTKRNATLTRSQKSFIYKFHEFMEKNKCIYPDNGQSMQSIENLLENQSRILYGIEKKTLISCPKLVDSICKRLIDVIDGNQASNTDIIEGIIGKKETDEATISIIKVAILQE